MASAEAMASPPYANLVLNTAAKRVGLRAAAARQPAPDLQPQPEPLTTDLVWRNAATLLLLATTPVHQRLHDRSVQIRRLTIPLEDESGSIRIESSDIGVSGAEETGEIRFSYIHSPTFATNNIGGGDRTIPLFSLQAGQSLPDDELDAINYFVELARIHAPQQAIEDMWRNTSMSLLESGRKLHSDTGDEAEVAEFTTRYIRHTGKPFTNLLLHGVLTLGQDVTGQIEVEEVRTDPVETRTPLFTLSTAPTKVNLSFPDQTDEPQTEEATWERINDARQIIGIIVDELNEYQPR